jgi:RNA polymerase sigma factor (sigma-70 family)
VLPRGERLLTDELLARLVGRGSTRAFATLYERHHQSLYRYCRSIVREEHDAQDALQSTMTQAYAALRVRERDLAVRPWLFRIAHNESISLLRKRGREVGVGDCPEPIGVDLEVAVQTRARLSALVSDLRALPERQRSALIMRELCGLHLEEIAGALSTSTAGAKQALFEARNSLREIAEGREMPCEGVREAISARDGRMLRGRRIRAHLRACEDCRTFQAAIGTREADLRLLAPMLPGPAAGTILGALLSGSGSHYLSAGSVAASGSSLASTGGALSSGSSLLGQVGGPLIAKGIAAAAILAAATAGTVRLAGVSPPSHSGNSHPRAGSNHRGANTAGAGARVVGPESGKTISSTRANRQATVLGATAGSSASPARGHGQHEVSAQEQGGSKTLVHRVHEQAGSSNGHHRTSANGAAGKARSHRPAASGEHGRGKQGHERLAAHHAPGPSHPASSQSAPVLAEGANGSPARGNTAHGQGETQSDGVQVPASEAGAAR